MGELPWIKVMSFHVWVDGGVSEDDGVVLSETRVQWPGLPNSDYAYWSYPFHQSPIFHRLGLKH